MSGPDVATWIKAWESGMAVRGFPRARLDVFEQCGPAGVGLTYKWTADINQTVDPNWAPVHDDSWELAHVVFIEVDQSRPSQVRPSAALLEMLDRTFPPAPGRRIAVTDAMNAATTVSDMADAFHPTAYPVPDEEHTVHLDNVLDAIEAALLFGAGRITRGDFLAAVADVHYEEVV